MAGVPGTTWNERLLEQLTFQWDVALRPGLDGFSDEEYFWEPAAGASGLRARADATTSMAAGAGDLVIDWAWPEPSPAPVTTIGWRLAHITVGCFGTRNAAHFGAPEVSYGSYDVPTTAAGALDRLDEAYATWTAGVEGRGEAGLELAVGPAEGEWAEHPMATLVLHINREIIHHGAEILLLRQLFQAKGS